MARGGYREQGSDQAVRLVFRPLLGTGAMMALMAAVMVGLMGLTYFGLFVLRLSSGGTLVLFLGAIPLFKAARALLEQTHEVVIERDLVRLRHQRFLRWSERRVARGMIKRSELIPSWGGLRLQLVLRTGAPERLFGRDLDADTGQQFAQALERALDPDQIEALADEHRPAPARVG